MPSFANDKITQIKQKEEKMPKEYDLIFYRLITISFKNKITKEQQDEK